MNVLSAAVSPGYVRGASNPPPPAPKQDSGMVVDTSGGLAAGAIGLVMSGGAHALVKSGFSPGLAIGFDVFIGASTGAQLADQLGKSKVAGLAIGAGVGLGLAAAGIHFGWPGALVSAATCAVLRGVVAPTLLARQ